MNHQLSTIALALLLTACATAPSEPPPQQQERLAASSASSSAAASESATAQRVSAPALSALPERMQLEVPFVPQAPYANWAPPFDEACEEAALLLMEFALRGEPLSKATMAAEIRAMVQWEEANGYAVDITIAELAQVARDYLGRSATVYTGSDVTTQHIRELLAAGNPVIIPAAGQMLGNPYFSGEGPPYHMLVLTGYEPGSLFTSPRFVTNDPGTKRGEDYTYNVETVMNAIHDWTGSKETIREGTKVMMVVSH